MASRGRPKRLTDDVIAQLEFDIGLGVTDGTAARLAGVSPRSLRRWLAEGRRELADLSAEGRLALAVERARVEARTFRCEDAAEALERIAPGRWSRSP